MWRILCSGCGREQASPMEWRCPVCEGPFSLYVDTAFDARSIVGEGSMWRYISAFPYLRREEVVTLGEGWTPLASLGEGVSVKLDYLMPTGSFKDRGAALLISMVKRVMREMGVEGVLEDSSGNAGASIAAYSSRAGIPCDIYVPAKVSGPKAVQIEAYGARLRRIEGSREEVARRAQGEVGRRFYASHIWSPYFSEGVKTVAYEICEQTGWDPPDYIFLPASHGTLLTGVLKGLQHLVESGVIRALPTVVAVQALQASPLYHTYHNLPYSPPERVETVADALMSVAPPRLKEMVRLLRETKGGCEAATEEEVKEAHTLLRRRGLYVEPSSAVAYAGWAKWAEKGRIEGGSKVVIILTGSGLKANRLFHQHPQSHHPPEESKLQVDCGVKEVR